VYKRQNESLPALLKGHLKTWYRPCKFTII